MAFFRKRTPEVIRRGADGQIVEERKSVRLGGQKVEVRRVKEAPKPAPEPKQQHKPKKKPGSDNIGTTATVATTVEDPALDSVAMKKSSSPSRAPASRCWFGSRLTRPNVSFWKVPCWSSTM